MPENRLVISLLQKSKTQLDSQTFVPIMCEQKQKTHIMVLTYCSVETEVYLTMIDRNKFGHVWQILFTDKFL